MHFSQILTQTFQESITHEDFMNFQGLFPMTRLRRLRNNQAIRNLVKETQLNVNDLIQPLFIRYGKGIKNPIASMPGQFQISVDNLEDEIKSIVKLGITTVLLFGIPEHKDPLGQDSYSDNGIIQSAIRTIKKIAPELLVISDVCFCEYTDHGHCGYLHTQNTQENNECCSSHSHHSPNHNSSSSSSNHSSKSSTHSHEINLDNDKTLELLAKQAVSHAQAGVDIIAPSGNIDGMVFAIRNALDHAGYKHLPILSYAVKYASSMYGPFRQAAEGAPKFGDRRSYQMDYANANESIREAALDVAEGADMLMVKPAHAYLDIILRVKQTFPELPLGAYHTSGEFAMIKAAAQNGWLDEKSAVLEVLTAIRRAGADFIITYFAKDVAAWLKNGTSN
jgi:porphobilinogen synthase